MSKYSPSHYITLHALSLTTLILYDNLDLFCGGAMSTPRGYVDQNYLQMLAQLLLPYKLRSHGLMEISPGHEVLDVGCGPGTDTIMLAALTGPTGRVVGVDHDADMIAEADSRAEAPGVAAQKA
jgi:SAM-dependent methyltransferase